MRFSPTTIPSALDFCISCVPSGVPPGSVLRPLLFLVYVLPLGEILRSHHLKFHFYADDTQLHTSPEHHLTCLQTGLSEDKWKHILNLVHSASVCVQGTAFCNATFSTQLITQTVAQYTNISDACCRCRQQPANLIHMLWVCPRLTYYWTEIFQTYKIVFHILIDPNPLTAIIRIPMKVKFEITVQTVIAFTTPLARSLILLKWKHAPP